MAICRMCVCVCVQNGIHIKKCIGGRVGATLCVVRRTRNEYEYKYKVVIFMFAKFMAGDAESTECATNVHTKRLRRVRAFVVRGETVYSLLTTCAGMC